MYLSKKFSSFLLFKNLMHQIFIMFHIFFLDVFSTIYSLFSMYLGSNTYNFINV